MYARLSLAGTHEVELILCGQGWTFDIPAGQSCILGSDRRVYIPNFVNLDNLVDLEFLY